MTWEYHSVHVIEIAFGVVTGLMLIFCVVIIYWIITLRDQQPLKKKSPLLMIASVIGQFLVLFNISMCCIYF